MTVTMDMLCISDIVKSVLSYNYTFTLPLLVELSGLWSRKLREETVLQ